MSAFILDVGKGYQASDVFSLEKGDIVTVMLVGGTRALASIEVKTTDGDAEAGTSPTFRTLCTMRGADPKTTIVQLNGPMDYRVVRPDFAGNTGCTVRYGTGGQSGDDIDRTIESNALVFPARAFSDSPDVPMDPDYYDGPNLISNPNFSNNAEGWQLGACWSVDSVTGTLVSNYTTTTPSVEDACFICPVQLEAGGTYEVAITFHSRTAICPYFLRFEYWHDPEGWYGPLAYSVTALSPKAEGEKTYNFAIHVGDNDHPAEGSRIRVRHGSVRAVGEGSRVKSVQIRKLKVRTAEIRDEYGISILGTQDTSQNVRDFYPSKKDLALVTGRPIVSAVETNVYDDWPYVSSAGPNISIGTGAGGSKILGGRGHISIGLEAGNSGEGWGCIAIGDSADSYGQGGGSSSRVVMGGRAGNGAFGDDIVAIGELAAGGNNMNGTIWAPQSVSIGRRAEPGPIGGSGIQSVAIGFLAKAGGDYSIAVGANASGPLAAYQAMWGSTLIQRHTFHGGAVFNESGVGGTVDFRVEGDTDQYCFVVDYSADAVGIGTSDATAKLDVNGSSIRLRTARTPASATAPGHTGEIAWDANYVYVCVAQNTWKRSPLSTW